MDPSTRGGLEGDLDFIGHPRDLGLAPVGDFAREAEEAVTKEYRATSRTVRLTCYEVRALEEGHPRLFRLDVGRFVDVDWTWEGAQASSREDRLAEVDPFDDATECGWGGEVVEADQDRGHLYIVADTAQPPTRGEFLVRPFEFLRSLNEVYRGREMNGVSDSLEAALAAGEGRQTGHLLRDAPALPSLAATWRHSWCAIWGPPGTGKTYTVGRQVAETLQDPSERVLVVSTTNRATDGAALQVARALIDRGAGLAGVARIGKGADISRFEAAGAAALLEGGEANLRHELSDLVRQRDRTLDPARRAELGGRILGLRRAIKEAASALMDPHCRVVVCTVFRAVTAVSGGEVADLLSDGRAPFTTVIVDEAGLVSRAVCAVLSLLAARRFVLVGDPRQLAPISRMSRILPPDQARWLARSGLSHLDDPSTHRENVTLLRRQHRMAPEVREVVSNYMYGGALTDAPGLRERVFPYDPLLAGLPRAVWYVLDEDLGDSPLAHIRAERGPGHRSWVRRRSREVLRKLLQAHPAMASARGLYLTPFVAQGREIRGLLAEDDVLEWQSCTVHSQQGAEADYVIFDPVNAGSTAWPYDEWRRLVNVAISRARQFVVVMASRLEMQEPYMSPLRRLLAPFTLRRTGSAWRWEPAADEGIHHLSAEVRDVGTGLGSQIEHRKALRPVLSAEQQRLCGYRLDGKPRLVRGVAGSGKTLVLANWLARTLADDGFAGRAWVVYANKSLRGLLNESIEAAWEQIAPGTDLPLDRFDLHWISDLLDLLRREWSIRAESHAYDYDAAARALLDRVPRDRMAPRCDALFVDEAQDFGPSALELLAALVRPTGDDATARQAMIFYDNAQNVFGRGTPKWADLGLDMVGRSTVMRESFRSTRVISEFALNVLYRLEPPHRDPDHRELVTRGLVEPTQREGRPWWRVHFNQVEGPLPEYRRYPDRDAEMVALARALERWIGHDGVMPRDIKILCNSQEVRDAVLAMAGPVAGAVGARLEHQVRQAFSTDQRTLVVSTAHSFKGYDAEIVVVPGVDRFVARGKQVLAPALYVAMTRARSVLRVSSTAAPRGTAGETIVNTLSDVHGVLCSAPATATPMSREQHVLELRDRLPANHHAWFDRLAAHHPLTVAPVYREDRSVVAEPLFLLDTANRRYACFGEDLPLRATVDELDDAGIRILLPGDEPS